MERSELPSTDSAGRRRRSQRPGARQPLTGRMCPVGGCRAAGRAPAVRRARPMHLHEALYPPTAPRGTIALHRRVPPPSCILGASERPPPRTTSASAPSAHAVLWGASAWLINPPLSSKALLPRPLALALTMAHGACGSAQCKALCCHQGHWPTQSATVRANIYSPCGHRRSPRPGQQPVVFTCANVTRTLYVSAIANENSLLSARVSCDRPLSPMDTSALAGAPSAAQAQESPSSPGRDHVHREGG